MSERICPVCGRHFYPRTGTHRFCSPVCRERRKGEIRKLQPARYGFTHQRTRKLVALEVAAGQARCPRCGEMILPGEPFDLDHADGAGNGSYLGASHRSCNRAAGNKREVREPFSYWQDAQGRWWRADYQGVPVRASRQW